MAAVAAAQAQEAAREDAAVEEGLELVLDELRQVGAGGGFSFGEEGPGMLSAAYLRLPTVEGPPTGNHFAVACENGPQYKPGVIAGASAAAQHAAPAAMELLTRMAGRPTASAAADKSGAIKAKRCDKAVCAMRRAPQAGLSTARKWGV